MANILIDEDHGRGKFQISLIGTSTKETYIGNFTVKCLLSPLEFLECDKLYRQLIGTNALEMLKGDISTMAFALAQLQYRVVECPPFWKNTTLGGSEILDYNIIIKVLDLALEAESQFKQLKINNKEKLEKQLTKAVRNKSIKATKQDL